MDARDIAAARGILERRNDSLQRDLVALDQTLAQAAIPSLLEPYRMRVRQVCQGSMAQVRMNLHHLGLGQDNLLDDVLSNTQQATRMARLISRLSAMPLLRSAPSDELGLRLITWTHHAHPETAAVPAAFIDGSPAVWPLLMIAPVYCFPCLEQRGLLHLPLYFHEFGHVLYLLHRQEMNDLVRDLQEQIEDALRPGSQRNDRHAEEQEARQRVVVDAWYHWAQELFCDAVGLVLGGPAFLRALSTYLGEMKREDFYRTENDLRSSTHPVTWLRIRLLVARARALGWLSQARAVEDEWAVVARALGVQEDYHGFYDAALAPAVEQALSDMLIEASPRPHLPGEGAPGRDWAPGDAPVLLLNRAWEVLDADPTGYPDWESAAVETFLSADADGPQPNGTAPPVSALPSRVGRVASSLPRAAESG